MIEKLIYQIDKQKTSNSTPQIFTTGRINQLIKVD